MRDDEHPSMVARRTLLATSPPEKEPADTATAVATDLGSSARRREFAHT